MEILALYESSDNIGTALAAGARHLAGIVEGFALIYCDGADPSEPDGWAGFTCAQDAQTAGASLATFRTQSAEAERPLRCDAPTEPTRVWERANGGVFGFPLRHSGRTRGVAIVGCPGSWPRVRNAEIESVLRQITLVLDHHGVSVSGGGGDEEPGDELLRLSEQLLAQDIE